jgi:hypothetical protein
MRSVPDEDHEEEMISPFGQHFIHLRATRLMIGADGVDRIITIKTPTKEYRIFIGPDCEIVDPNDVNRILRGET